MSSHREEELIHAARLAGAAARKLGISRTPATSPALAVAA
jgi:hypothetical protein